MDAATFLRSICDEPDLDEPRLVFADWLEDQGDPRSDFIRTQIEYTRVGNNRTRALQLLRRERSLLLQNRRAWEAPFADLDLREVTYRRGFIEDIVLHARSFLEQASAIFERAPVRRVALFSAAGYATELRDCPWLARVQSLDLSDNRLDDTHTMFLLGSPHLRNVVSVNLHRNPVSTQTIEFLLDSQRFGRLAEVDLTSTVDFRRHPSLLQKLRDRFGPGLATIVGGKAFPTAVAAAS